MQRAVQKRNASPFNQLEFCFGAANQPPLPGPAQLQQRASVLLEGLGAGKLAAKLRIEWNPRMRTAAGRADFSRRLITLNPTLQRFGAEEIERTFRHELAHLLTKFRFRSRRILPHGSEWRAACRDLGIEDERACHKLPLMARTMRRHFVYRCRGCRCHFPRVRRIRRATACLACCRRFANGDYDERFRLELVKASSPHRFSRFLSINFSR